MITEHKNKANLKDIGGVAEAAAGDLANEKVKHCYVCADRGYPHEAVEIHKTNGRLRNDGTYDIKGHEIRDYYTGRPHQHKERYFLGFDLEAMLK
jgi:hypothetical protein